MQAVNPANIATMNCNRKRKSRGNGLYALLISRQEEIIGFVTQTNHEATRYTQYRNSISKSHMCI